MDDIHYFNYLRKRSLIGLMYRWGYLYPLLSRYLKGDALDVGCGIGDLLRFRKNTLGVDINRENVNWCKKNGLDAILIEGDMLPFAEKTFSSAIMDNVLEHITEPETLIAEVHRVLDKQAPFIVGVPGKRGYRADPDHKVFYDENSLVKTISEAHFSLEKIIYTPFRSNWLDNNITQYCLYGVFHKK